MSKPYPTPRLGISAPQAVSKISGCGVGVPHPIGGSALVNVVLLVLVDLGGGPPGIGFWSIRIQWMVSESGAKNDGFWWSGTGLGIGCLSIRI